MRIGLGAALALLLAGSALAQPSATQPVSFTKMGARIPAGTPWAHLQSDVGRLRCADDKVLTWDAEDNKVVQASEYERVFRETLSEGGFRVSGDPTNLFEEDKKSADLQVGALMTGLNATVCAATKARDFWLNTGRTVTKGSASMQLEWQIYSAVQGKVLARIPTSGSGEEKAGIDAGAEVLLQRAFAANVRQLIASEAFRQAVSAPGPRPAASLGGLPSIALRTVTARRPIGDASSSVAVVFAGAGTGSAFLVSTDGYLITNHHVVGDATRVRLRWPDNSETVGEVIRSDRRRDVALVKTDARARVPLALHLAPPTAGETVFAIGTPLDRDFQNTVTKGVVSANRVYEGLSFIQSDVAVDHGNSGGPLLDESGRVLGITQWGYSPDGVSHNLNFFIPIGDALRALALKPAA